MAYSSVWVGLLIGGVLNLAALMIEMSLAELTSEAEVIVEGKIVKMCLVGRKTVGYLHLFDLKHYGYDKRRKAS